tara:strand:- start:346 stop:1281 length:936 start_codon:yes stop_codon:yes gene_type:complete
MFHHFHDDNIHKMGQGSISANQFEEIINYIGRKNILNPDEFILKLINGSLKNNEVCLTFDDGIRCQYDVARPILDKYDIKAFFFIYSSILTDEPDLLEVFRFFRLNFYDDVDSFYNDFFKKVNKDLEKFFDSKINLIEEKKYKFPVYSLMDIKFRLVRDLLLTKIQYVEIMNGLFKDKNFTKERFFSKLFMSEEMIIKLSDDGHKIGLHSHTHPMMMENLSYKDQLKEFEQNLLILEKVIKSNIPIVSMSHPCGSYNEDTLKILKKMNIKIGFKSIMKIEKNKNMKKINNTSLEIAREDHINIYRKIINKF